MQLKLVQLNTLHGGEIFEPMVQFLKEQNGDILHLQEVFNNETGRDFENQPNYSLFQYIQNNFGYASSAFSKTYEWPIVGNQRLPLGNATFSRFNINNFHVVYMPGHEGFDYEQYAQQQPKDFSKGPANFIASEIQVGDKKLKSINIHGVWGFDGEDNQRRLAMRDQILEEIKNDEYVVISGDFNTTPETQTMLGLEKRLINVFKDELLTTFNGKRWKKPDPNFVVDYVFVSPNIKVIEHHCPQVDISDHLPLVVTMEL